MSLVSSIAVGSLVVALLALPFFFTLTLYSLMLKVKKEHRAFKPWLLWFMLFPVFGYFFAWYFLPFGVPDSLKRAVASEGKDSVTFLFWAGLAIQVIPLADWLFCASLVLSFLCILMTIALIVLSIMYWRRCYVIGQKYLTLES
jgi:hypothetical protein